MSVWTFLDPLLLRMRARLEHLEEFQPSARAVQLLRAKGTISPRATIHPDARLYTHGRPENLVIGDYANINGDVVLERDGARCSIGRYTYVGPLSRIWTTEQITIGDYVLISHLVDIIDNNSHSFDWSDRRRDAENLFEKKIEIDRSRIDTAPVIIENDVWIGAKSTILKGVHIGRGAVVAAASVVTKNIDPFTLVAGSPARVIRELPQVAHEP
jgi:maltose O-acetyltransferase